MQNHIMDEYPVDIDDIKKMRRDNYIGVRDVYLFKQACESELEPDRYVPHTIDATTFRSS